jgi:hypothetical protein
MRRIKHLKQSGYTRTTELMPVTAPRTVANVSIAYKPRPKTIVVPVAEAWAILTEDTLLRYEAVVKAKFATICTNKV